MIARRDAIAGPGREKGQAQLNDRGSSRCADSVLASALSQLATLPGYCLDFLVETIVADWLVLIERHAQVGARGVIQCGAKQIAIRFTSWSLVRREGQVEGMWREDRIPLSKPVRPVTRPRVIVGVRHHTRAHRVELDVSLA